MPTSHSKIRRHSDTTRQPTHRIVHASFPTHFHNAHRAPILPSHRRRTESRFPPTFILRKHDPNPVKPNSPSLIYHLPPCHRSHMLRRPRARSNSWPRTRPAAACPSSASRCSRRARHVGGRRYVPSLLLSFPTGPSPTDLQRRCIHADDADEPFDDHRGHESSPSQASYVHPQSAHVPSPSS